MLGVLKVGEAVKLLVCVEKVPRRAWKLVTNGGRAGKTSKS